jgi:hypothetical protein
MLKILLLAVLAMTCFAQEPQQTIVENFATDPALRRWETFGEAGLIRWNSDAENIDVTWDSSRPNSFLRLPLGTIMTRRDDFDVSLDLLLHDFSAGVNPNKPGTFQLAFGFQNYADAERSTFFRAGANAAPNLVEFNFMPDTGFGPTIWPAAMSTNGAMNYSGASDFSNFDLPIGEVMRVSLAYRATNETLTITIMTNGSLVGPVTRARLATNDVAFGKRFTQFQVGTFAVASYSDAEQGGAYAGSILAHGIIDNIEINFPPAPIRDFVGAFFDGMWQASFLSRAHWLYQLQRTEDFYSWREVGEPRDGDGNRIQLNDTDILPRAAFYRISAQPIN